MQEIFQGEGSLGRAVEVISGNREKKIFLITGRHFLQGKKPGFLNNYACAHYIKSGANVRIGEVEEAWQAWKKSDATVILAIGGGSVMDLAKIIVWNAVQQKHSKPLLAAAPTTTGSGSEATQFAVLYEDNKKQSISHPSLLPDVVVLDPELLQSLSHYQAAVSGMDVLAQAVESWWSRAATEESKQHAVIAISLWKEYFIASLQASNTGARAKMQQAAYKSGQAINITRTTGPHALSYYLTAEYNVPHGQAVALFLPLFFLYNQPLAELSSCFGVADTAGAVLYIKEKMKEAGLATSMTELGIDKQKIIDHLLAAVNEERFSNNPVAFNHAQLKKLITEQL